MKHRDYEIIDFLKDEQFKRWIIDPDEDSNYYWNSFLDSFPEKRSPVIQAKALLLAFHFPENNLAEPDPVEQRELYKKILNSSKSKDAERANRLYFSFRSSGLRIAAILSMTLMAAYILYHSGPRPTVENQPIEINMVTKSAPYGQKLTTVLPDGSIVKMNSGSTLKYPEKFSDIREVHLQGEAFFEVVNDPDHPFVVHSDNFETKVLGTSFNIRNYGGNSDAEVAVLSGMVSVSSLSENNEVVDGVILKPMRMVVFREASGKLIEKNFSYDQVMGWKDNLICFHNAGFDEIVETLERWYGVKFNVQRKFPGEKDFSGEYRAKPLAIILEGLSYTFGFNFKIDGETVQIE